MGLALGEDGDDGIAFFLIAGVAGGGEHLRASGHVMADEMAAEFAVGGFPAAEGLGVGREAGVDEEIAGEAVGVEGKEIGAVEVHGVFEGAVEEADVLEREGPDGDGDDGRDLVVVMAEGEGIGAGGESQDGWEEKGGEESRAHRRWSVD
jgi:hypothetical protein